MQFRWIRDGINQLGDNVEINMALGLLTMELTNLTMNDGGTYTCMATSERASRSDHIILNISEKVQGTVLRIPSKGVYMCASALLYFA